VFSFQGIELRTIAYVDGYNLFFGCLRGTPYKWLDVHALLKEVLRVQDPDSELVCVKYFTAPIRESFARRGQEAANAQGGYLRALKSRGGLYVFEGRFSAEPTNAICYADPPDKDKRVRVWRLEEKQTDVAIAIAMYRDAVRGEVDQVLLVSNDSDMVPAIRALKADTKVRVGMVFALPEPDAPNHDRRPNAELAELADWHRRHVRNDELAAAQLPRVVQTKRKPVHKPAYW